MRFSRLIFLIIFFTFSQITAEQLYSPKTEQVVHSTVQKYMQNNASQIPVWIYFTDKEIFSQKELDSSLEKLSQNYSKKTLDRRRKTSSHLSFSDLAVSKNYIDQLKALGFDHRHSSKWFNAVSGLISSEKIETISQLYFVKEIKLLYSTTSKQFPSTNVETKSLQKPGGFDLNYGSSFTQLEQINVPGVHKKGFDGNGIIIALFDTGFNLEHQSLQHVDVLAEYDFVFNDSVTSNQFGDTGSQHNHGTEVLSVIGGRMDFELYGPAFDATYILGKTEDNRSETVIEEDNMVAAIEWADSLGTDIISTSLGYNDWYRYSDMDGQTAITTLAAAQAVKRGIVFVTSAGNERDNAWYYMTAPADADSILTIGAVDANGTLSYFSSAGPTFDGRIKPEVCAMGSKVKAASPYDLTSYVGAYGTSFSAPLAAGAAALVLQAHPDWTPMQVREALMMTASQAQTPDNDYGYGIINTLAAINYQKNLAGDVNGDGELSSGDALLIAQIAINPNDYSPEQITAADVNNDGHVNIKDVVLLLKSIN